MSTTPMNENTNVFNIHEFFRLNNNLTLWFVLSLPRSDMGKGHISMNLSKILPNSHILKYLIYI